jgi:hypothetical protein
VLTKHPGTGGLVSTRTATEQALYEIGDPRAYASPDVIADFTSCRFEQAGKDRVAVRGVKGRPPTDFLKVSMTYDAGFKIQCDVVVSGPDAVAKAEAFADIYWARVPSGPDAMVETRTEMIGHSACWGSVAAAARNPNEVVLRFSARAAEPKPLERMARELAGIALAGPAGICGAGARPHVSPAYGYWPALIPRSMVTARMFLAGTSVEFPCSVGPSAMPTLKAEGAEPASSGRGPRVRVPLSRVAYGRSGDKGDACNIGIAALRAELYPELLREVTAERVKAWFAPLVQGEVTRYRLDNLTAMNFLMRQSLGGGGTLSLRLDHQGKTLAQGLLTMEVEIAQDLLEGD